MPRFAFFAALLIVSAPVIADAAPGRGAQSGAPSKDQRDRGVLPLSEIERRILPTMAGKSYLGPEYDPVAMAYRLKFIQAGRVTYVDVDARSGRILHRTR